MAKHTVYGLPGVYNSSPLTLSDGDGAAVALTVNGYTIVVNADGTAVGGGTEYIDGGTPPANPHGPTIIWNEGGTWRTVSAAKPLPVTATVTPSGTQDVNLTKIGGTTFSLGQQLAAVSVPIVLTAAQITTLTPPSAIANFALETGGNLATIAGAITSSVVQDNIKQINGVIPLMGNGGTGTGSQRVTIASDNTAFSINAIQSGTWTVQPGNTPNSTPWLVTNTPSTSGGWSVGNFTSGDTYTALTNSAQVIKASAGQIGGWYIMNPNTVTEYVFVYNIAAANVTVGTSTATLVIAIPAGAAANVEFANGIPCGTAMSCAAATTGGGNTAPTTALEAMFFYK